MSALKKALFVSVLFVFVSAASAAELKPVKYVFLFIGDGMSIPQRMMAEEYLKKTQNTGLRINAMPQQAITTTYAANSFITDSAASGTAIACGAKTNNGAVGVNEKGERLESIAEVAHKSGKKVGIISTVTLNHATPASFYAHRANRGQSYDIGLDLVASGFEYFGGGGINGHKGSKNKEGVEQEDIFDLAKKAGYTVCRTQEKIKALKRGTDKVVAIGSETDLPYAIDASEDGLKLADFTKQAIELLDNPKGFFMMVEGGKIDWMCHANDAATTLSEIIDFDNAVKKAFDFAEKHPSETLIVVTGDHETGGLTLGFAGTGYASFIELLGSQKASLDVLKKTFADYAKKNPEASFDTMKALITEKSGLIFAADGKGKNGTMILTAAEQEELATKYGDKKYDELSNAVIRFVNHKSGLAWTSNAHTALPVNTTAWGPGADAFFGMIDNTDIAKKLKQTVIQPQRQRRVFRR
ncbi:MAG: alkaline phosphatase [Planctomycetaceae bacterium]|jgi:alkaline phosphatase|nr:alkaline phosphatase [Planctomycetaceae bacterium]